MKIRDLQRLDVAEVGCMVCEVHDPETGEVHLADGKITYLDPETEVHYATCSSTEHYWSMTHQ